MCHSISADSADDTSGYNPPKFVLDAAKEALNRVDANQYSPTKVSNRPKHHGYVNFVADAV